MSVSADTVKELRQITGAGIVNCKKALVDTNGDVQKAVEVLRKRGVDIAAKKSHRSTTEGRVESYIHLGGKIGVLVELGCETDFVAKCDDFSNLIKNIAMQIAAHNPLYLKREDIPAESIEKEKEIFRAQIKDKPENIVEKIVEGKVEKFFQEVCLLDQAFIKEPKFSIKDCLTQVIAKVGENIVVKRFMRFQVGE